MEYSRLILSPGLIYEKVLVLKLPGQVYIYYVQPRGGGRSTLPQTSLFEKLVRVTHRSRKLVLQM